MKKLCVGIGCRSHSSADEIDAAVRVALGALGVEQIRTVASIDTKSDSQGLLAFCARHTLPLQLFSREQIAALPVENPSAAGRAHLGVDGVCEPCALLAASSEPDSPARLLVPKTLHGGVTVAIATNAAPAANPNTDPQDLR